MRRSLTSRFLLAVVVAAFALAIRLPGLGAILTADEPQWVFRSQTFWRGLTTGDPGATFQGTHPGVVPMYLIGAGIRIQEHLTGDVLESPRVGKFRRAAKLPPATAVSILIGISAAVVARLWGVGTGAAAGMFLATEPYFVGHSQLAHVDALLSIFVVLGTLLLILARRAGRARPVVAAGMAAGLALLTKLPALVLIPFAVGTLILPRGGRVAAGAPRDRRRLRPTLAALLWCVVAAAMFVFLWPSTWVSRFDANLGFISRDVRTVATEPHAGEAAEAATRGVLFYPRALSSRLSPVTIILAVVGCWFAVRRRGARAPDAWFLLAAALAFSALLFVTEKRADRYALPVMTLADVVAGIGLAGLLQRVWRPVVSVAGIGFVLGLVTIRHAPYAVAYASPVGPALDETQSGWGEGLEQAAELLNRHPRAESLVVASWYPAVFQEFFRGQTMSLSSRDDARVTHVVLYRNMRGRAGSAPSDILEEYARRTTAEQPVQVLGRDIAWIYATGTPREYTNHSGELVRPSASGPGRAIEVGEFQTATAAELSGVRLVFANFSSRRTAGTVRVHLREDPDGPDVRAVSLRAADLPDGAWIDARFAPIAASREMTYFVAVTSPDGQPGTAVALKFQPTDVRPGRLVILRAPLGAGEQRRAHQRPGDLALSFLYGPSPPVP